jgi:hypothetical protein
LLVLIFDPLHLLDRSSDEKPVAIGGERERRYEENRDRNEKTAEMDALLDKVARDGMPSLSNWQRKRLEQLSKDLYGQGETSDANSGRNNK